MTRATMIGVAPAAPGSAPAPTRSVTPCGRYRYFVGSDPLDVKATELTLPDIRSRLSAAVEDAARALSEGDEKRIARRLEDVRLLGRAIQRFEVLQERARLGGGET